MLTNSLIINIINKQWNQVNGKFESVKANFKDEKRT